MSAITPKVRDYDGDLSKRWAVWVNVPAGNTTERRIYWISQKFKTKLERYAEADRIINEIQDKVNRGEWADIKKVSTGYERLENALNSALEFKKNYISNRTYQSYSNLVKRLNKWIRKEGLQNIRVDQFTEFHANAFIQIISSGKSAKTINSYTGYLASLWERIGKLTPCKNVFKIDRLPEKQPDIALWDPASLDKITSYLKENDPGMFLVVLLIFHCFMRPNEIRQVQFKDIDLDRGIIKVSGQKSKSRRFKYPTLSRQLIDVFLSMASNYPADYFIISRGFKPGPEPISRNIISERFKKIRRALGIQDVLKLYSFKHTGNTKMIEKGLNIRELQAQNGHHDISITERYLQRLYSNANEKFRDLSDDL